MATRTHIASGNILHDHKLYVSGDPITFDESVSDDEIADLTAIGVLGGDQARIVQRMRDRAEDQSGLRSMTEDELRKLWKTTSNANRTALLRRERDEARRKDTAEEVRKGNIDEGLAASTGISGEQSEALILATSDNNQSLRDARLSARRDVGKK